MIVVGCAYDGDRLTSWGGNGNWVLCAKAVFIPSSSDLTIDRTSISSRNSGSRRGVVNVMVDMFNYGLVWRHSHDWSQGRSSILWSDWGGNGRRMVDWFDNWHWSYLWWGWWRGSVLLSVGSMMSMMMTVMAMTRTMAKRYCGNRMTNWFKSNRLDESYIFSRNSWTPTVAWWRVLVVTM